MNRSNYVRILSIYNHLMQYSCHLCKKEMCCMGVWAMMHVQTLHTKMVDVSLTKYLTCFSILYILLCCCKGYFLSWIVFLPVKIILRSHLFSKAIPFKIEMTHLGKNFYEFTPKIALLQPVYVRKDKQMDRSPRARKLCRSVCCSVLFFIGLRK